MADLRLSALRHFKARPVLHGGLLPATCETSAVSSTRFPPIVRRSRKAYWHRSPSQQLAKNRLRWTGHALRSVDKVLYKVLMFVPEGGQRGRGCQRLRFYDTVKEELNGVQINATRQEDFWPVLAIRGASRATWRTGVVNA